MKLARPAIYATAFVGLGLAPVALWFCGGGDLVVEILTRQVEREEAERAEREREESGRSWAEVVDFAGDGDKRRPVRVASVEPPVVVVENERGERLVVRIVESQAPEVGDAWIVRGGPDGPALERLVSEGTP